MSSKRSIKSPSVTRPAGMQAMGQALYEQIRQVVMSVPEVLGCHQIRSRGTFDHVFLDLHVWFPADAPLRHAHEVSHVVKDRLLETYPQIADAIIHIEPPPNDR